MKQLTIHRHGLMTIAAVVAGCALSYVVMLVLIDLGYVGFRTLFSVLTVLIAFGSVVLIWSAYRWKGGVTTSKKAWPVVGYIGFGLIIGVYMVVLQGFWSNALWAIDGDKYVISGGGKGAPPSDQWRNEGDFLGIYNNAAVLCQGGSQLNAPDTDEATDVPDTPVQRLGWTWLPGDEGRCFRYAKQLSEHSNRGLKHGWHSGISYMLEIGTEVKALGQLL